MSTSRSGRFVFALCSAFLLGFFAIALVVAPPGARADELDDLEVLTRIRHEGLRRSQVMEMTRHLTETIGPRLSGTPALRAANEWTRQKLESFGLENGRLEALDFGHGWSFDHCSVSMLSPRAQPLIAYPRAWTPGTDGPVEGEAMIVEIEKVEDLEEYRGKLEGKILFVDELREVTLDGDAAVTRYAEDELEELCTFPIPDPGPSQWRERRLERWRLDQELDPFLVEEGVVATVDVSSRDHGIVRLGRGGGFAPDAVSVVPKLQMATEHYNAVMRALQDEIPVRLRIDVGARFHTDSTVIHNTLADLRGRDRDAVVIAGAHLDSWHAGTGATDNAASCAVVMEAVRILASLDLELDRTIRVALWAGEEQGLLGSRHHVREHYATRPESTDPEQLALPRSFRDRTWPIEPLDAHEDFQVYFNLDNGAGRIRGIYTQENVAAGALFRRWLEPVGDLGADTVTNRSTSGTDHLAFDTVGLPGFQFVQDDVDYWPRTHHTQLDVIDHVVEEDLKVSSVVLAWMLYRAATMQADFPRKPMPTAPPDEG